MEYREATTTKERVLVAIQRIALLLFIGWFEIVSYGGINIILEYVVFGVISVVFLISHILYIIPARMARKAAKRAFYDSINNREKNIFDEYDADVFKKYDEDPFKIENSKEEK